MSMLFCAAPKGDTIPYMATVPYFLGGFEKLYNFMKNQDFFSQSQGFLRGFVLRVFWKFVYYKIFVSTGNPIYLL